MALLLTLKAALGQLARQPLTWLCAVTLAASWWVLEVLMPLGLATGSLHRSTAHYELGFLGGAIAQAIVLGECLKLRWIVQLRGPWWGLATDMLILVSAAAVMASFILIPAEVFQLWQFADFRTGQAMAALLLGWTHLAAMACVVPLRWSLAAQTTTFRDKVIGVSWIAFAAVVIPASVRGLSPNGAAILHIFDAGRMLRASFEPTQLSIGAWCTALLPAVGWSLVGLGLARRAAAAQATPTPSPCATPSSETSTPT